MRRLNNRVFLIGLILLCFIIGFFTYRAHERSNSPWTKACLVAHAGGGLGEQRYTNSLEAIEANYKKGHRIFELDMCLTSDGKMVCVHDWEHWNKITNTMVENGEYIPTETEFKNARIHDEYTPMTFADLLELMARYQDIYIYTDTKCTDEISIRKQFEEMYRVANELGQEETLNRLVVGLYNEEMWGVVDNIYPFEHYVFTTYRRWYKDLEEFEKICKWCVAHSVDSIDMWNYLYTREIKSIADRYGIYIGVFTENDVECANEFLDSGVSFICTDFISPDDISK